MLQILFTGTVPTLSKLQTTLKGYANVMPTGIAEVHLYEVCNTDDLKRIPVKSPMALFLIISTQDKTVTEQLNGLRISGIFLPPLNKDVIKRKLDMAVSSDIIVANSKENDFDSLKVKILAKAESINALPIYAQHLLKLTHSDISTIKEITEQIKKDQGISSKIIRMVNSSFFGIKQDINSIDRAVVLLGFNTLKNIALVAVTNAYYDKQFGMYRTTGNALWEHAHITALLCEMFANDMQEDTDTLFLAGLLHDIGKTIMADFLVQAVSVCEEERKQIGTDHAEVTGMVLQRWQLSSDVIQMTRMHHKPDNNIQSKIIYSANRLAHCKNNNGLLNVSLNSAFDMLPVKNHDALVKKITSVLSIGKEEIQ